MHSSQMEVGPQLYELLETAQVVRVYVDRDNRVYCGWQHEVHMNVCKLFVNILNMFANAPNAFMKFHKVFLQSTICIQLFVHDSFTNYRIL